jgi:hypothetical protein
VNKSIIEGCCPDAITVCVVELGWMVHMSPLIGHKGIDMTLRYADLSPDHKLAAMETLESRFPSKSPANFHNNPGGSTTEESAKVMAIR